MIHVEANLPYTHPCVATVEPPHLQGVEVFYPTHLESGVLFELNIFNHWCS